MENRLSIAVNVTEHLPHIGSGSRASHAMGVHDYKISLLPRVFFREHLPKTLSDANVDHGQDPTTGWWATNPPTERLLAAVRTLLPKDNSWADGDVEEYVSSSEFGSDIRIWKESGRVWDITFRFSPVSDPWQLMQQFVTMARNEHCVLLEEKSGAVFEPEERDVEERLAASLAMRFVRDPAGTIVQDGNELDDNND